MSSRFAVEVVKRKEDDPETVNRIFCHWVDLKTSVSREGERSERETRRHRVSNSSMHIYLFSPPYVSPHRRPAQPFMWCGKLRQNLRNALFWIITQRIMVISYRRFGTTYRSQLQRSEFGLHAGSTKFNTENDAWISACALLPVCVSVDHEQQSYTVQIMIGKRFKNCKPLIG